MKSVAFVLIKPDGIVKGLVGAVLDRFEQSGLELLTIRMKMVDRSLAEKHYHHIKGEDFFEGVVQYLTGQLHRQKKVMAMIYKGPEAIRKCRQIAGSTNPEEAHPKSIRGAFGRITTKGVFENIVHVSSTQKDAEREIKLWFDPDEHIEKLYPTELIHVGSQIKKVWK